MACNYGLYNFSLLNVEMIYCSCCITVKHLLAGQIAYKNEEFCGFVDVLDSYPTVNFVDRKKVHAANFANLDKQNDTPPPHFIPRFTTLHRLRQSC